MLYLFALVLLLATQGNLVWAAQGDPVKHIPAKEVEVALGKPVAPITKADNYSVLALRRTSAGQAEVHSVDTDVFYVIDGSATFTTGGTVIDGKTTAPGEIRGTGIREGTSRVISKGDVLTIPHGTPHWFSEVKSPVIYLVVKVATGSK